MEISWLKMELQISIESFQLGKSSCHIPKQDGVSIFMVVENLGSFLSLTSYVFQLNAKPLGRNDLNLYQFVNIVVVNHEWNTKLVPISCHRGNY